MIELILTAYLQLTEPDVVICIWDEEDSVYDCEEEVYNGMDCEQIHNIMICERLLEV